MSGGVGSGAVFLKADGANPFLYDLIHLPVFLQIAMTFNTGLFIAVIVGYFLGVFLFGSIPENFARQMQVSALRYAEHVGVLHSTMPSLLKQTTTALQVARALVTFLDEESYVNPYVKLNLNLANST